MYFHKSKKSNEESISDVIKEIQKLYKWDDKYITKNIKEVWLKLMGKPIANHTTDIFISNKRLHITLDSASLKSELNFSKEKIIEIFNKHFNKEVLIEVIIR